MYKTDKYSNSKTRIQTPSSHKTTRLSMSMLRLSDASASSEKSLSPGTKLSQIMKSKTVTVIVSKIMKIIEYSAVMSLLLRKKRRSNDHRAPTLTSKEGKIEHYAKM